MDQHWAFLEQVRAADWDAVRATIREGDVDLSVPTPGTSVFAWLIGLNAPTEVVLDLLAAVRADGSTDVDKLGLLEECLSLPSHVDNARQTFLALLDAGLDPNVISRDRGMTLFNIALALNRVAEVEAMLRRGVDPHRMNAFGYESTSNIEEARLANNEAGRLALRWWSEGS